MITFIIPSINRETLDRTIQSLKNQTNNNWKCIIIYDGVEPSKEYVDDRIKVLKIDKTGIIKNSHGQSGLVRNYGLEFCDTEWIGFLDDDDTINPLYVDTLLNKYNDYDFIIWRMTDKYGLILPPVNLDIIKFGYVGISLSFKKGLLKYDLKFESNKDGEDYDFIKKLESITDKYKISEEIFYNVRH
jgi:glycosyltransferase involved in cell wall biosynthesis